MILKRFVKTENSFQSLIPINDMYHARSKNTIQCLISFRGKGRNSLMVSEACDCIPVIVLDLTPTKLWANMVAQKPTIQNLLRGGRYLIRRTVNKTKKLFGWQCLWLLLIANFKQSFCLGRLSCILPSSIMGIMYLLLHNLLGRAIFKGCVLYLLYPTPSQFEFT